MGKLQIEANLTQKKNQLNFVNLKKILAFKNFNLHMKHVIAF